MKTVHKCGTCKYVGDIDVSGDFGEPMGTVRHCSLKPFPVRIGQLAGSCYQSKEPYPGTD